MTMAHRFDDDLPELPPDIRLLHGDFPLPEDDEAPARYAGQEPADVPAAEPATTRRLSLLSDLELDALPEPTPLVEGVAFANSLVVLVGKYGTFKSFLLIDLALCIGVGADWHGRRVRKGPVVYICPEGTWGVRRRVAAWKASYQYEGLGDVYFLPSAVDLSAPGQVAALLAEIAARDLRPAVVIVDTIARSMSGDESKVEDMGRFIRGCDTIRETTGAAVFAAHHAGWAADRSRGSSSLPGACDTEIYVERDDMVVTLKCTKMKDAAEFPAITLEAFPIAGSLAFRTVVPLRPDLTRNEQAALNAVQIADGLSAKAWEEASELSHGSFHNARKRLLALAYVKHAKNLYRATDAGTLALGTKDNGGTTEVQSRAPHEVQSVHTPKGVDLVLGQSELGLNGGTK